MDQGVYISENNSSDGGEKTNKQTGKDRIKDNLSGQHIHWMQMILNLHVLDSQTLYIMTSPCDLRIPASHGEAL